MFSGASNFVEGVDTAFALIIGISLFFLILIMGVLIYIVFRFSKKRNPVAQQFHGSVTLEIIWTVIPLILVLLMFYYGYLGFAEMRRVPKDTMTIDAIGRMWEWEFVYPNGKRCKDTLVVPLNKPVKLNLISEDVNHSFFIPAFRIKEDMVKNFENYMWFIPTKLGDYDIFCTEYCGLKHSNMIGIARVVEDNKYENWLAQLPDPKDIKDPEGLALIKNNGCTACHSMDGSKIVGASFKGFYGIERVLESGEKVTADDEYIKESIKNPAAKVVKGFPPAMQSYEGKLTDEDISKITEYLKTIK